MKKLLPLTILLVFLLAGCQGLLQPPVAPTPSDSEMATEVSKILTQMPTATQPLPEATNPLPEPAQTDTAPSPTTAESTSAPVEPTATSAPATQAPSPTSAEVGGGQVPTVAVTPLGPGASPTAGGATATSQSTVAVTPLVTLVPVQATGTPPVGDPRTFFGEATWTDNMDQDTNWAKGDDQYTSAVFENGVMRLTAESDLDGWRLAWPTIQRFYIEMTMQPGKCAGSDHYGMIVRVPEPSKADQGYLFGLTCDGRYSLRRWNGRIGTRGEMTALINWKSNPAVKSGENQVNRLGLQAQGELLTLYVNGVKVDSYEDDTFTEKGAFGVFIGQDETQDFTVQIDQVSYWEDPDL